MNTGDSDAQCIAFDEQHGITFTTVSGNEGGGTAVCNAYGIGAYPTTVLIAPNHDIVMQDLWPIPNAQTIISALESHGLEQNDCGGATLTADFTADLTDICLNNEVQFTDNSIGDPTTWTWTFEGGDPATSDEQNPVVTYSEAGSYTVTLTVTNDVDPPSEIIQEDYITVNSLAAAFMASTTDLCDQEQVQFTDITNCNATSWEWTFEGGDPATSTDQNPIVTYNTAGVYSVSLTASNDAEENNITEDSYLTVHNCTGLNSYAKLEMSITPNPGNGLFILQFNNQDYYEVTVYDITGHLLNRTTHSNNNNQLNISNLENGIYIIKASNGNTEMTERIVIRK